MRDMEARAGPPIMTGEMVRAWLGQQDPPAPPATRIEAPQQAEAEAQRESPEIAEVIEVDDTSSEPSVDVEVDHVAPTGAAKEAQARPAAGPSLPFPKLGGKKQPIKGAKSNALKLAGHESLRDKWEEIRELKLCLGYDLLANAKGSYEENMSEAGEERLAENEQSLLKAGEWLQRFGQLKSASEKYNKEVVALEKSLKERPKDKRIFGPGRSASPSVHPFALKSLRTLENSTRPKVASGLSKNIAISGNDGGGQASTLKDDQTLITCETAEAIATSLDSAKKAAEEGSTDCAPVASGDKEDVVMLEPPETATTALEKVTREEEKVSSSLIEGPD